MKMIDKDKVLVALRYYEDWECPATSSALEAIGQVREVVSQIPTLTLDDLRPKGRWVNWGKSGTPTYENYGTCSACHEDAEIYTEHRNYCPHCGADMRGGGEDG